MVVPNRWCTVYHLISSEVVINKYSGSVLCLCWPLVCSRQRWLWHINELEQV